MPRLTKLLPWEKRRKGASNVSIQDLAELANRYFEKDCKGAPSIAELSNYLGYSSYQSFKNAMSQRAASDPLAEEFYSWVRNRVQTHYEKQLARGESSSAHIQFALTNISRGDGAWHAPTQRVEQQAVVHQVQSKEDKLILMAQLKAALQHRQMEEQKVLDVQEDGNVTLVDQQHAADAEWVESPDDAVKRLRSKVRQAKAGDQGPFGEVLPDPDPGEDDLSWME